MLEAQGISFRYENGPWILEDLSFELQPGEVVGLPGPSGQGKSTLARILAGYNLPQRGQVLLDKQPLPGDGFSPVQLLFQHPELSVNPRWKIRDIIAEGHASDDRTLDMLSIDRRWLSRYPHELSGGELQRIALARVMTSQTRFLIADEMTAMLDSNTQALIWSAVLAWARSRDIGVLAISHDIHLLSRIADRVDDMFAVEDVAVDSPSLLRSAA